jgi:tripartite-type tricarboxylate transporter receptor subunit TctC
VTISTLLKSITCADALVDSAASPTNSHADFMCLSPFELLDDALAGLRRRFIIDTKASIRHEGAEADARWGAATPASREFAMNRTLVALALTCVASAAHSQPAADFYKGRQLRLITGHQVGNDYDVGARMLARYLPKHLPGQPTIIVQNMVAAASVAAVNYVYAQAPKDGSVIGTFSRNIPSQKLMGQANIEADPRRMNWLGATSFPARICTVWHTAPVKTTDDLFKHELIMGGAGAGSAPSILTSVFNHVLGTKFRVVEGYKGTQDIVLAVERGEVQGVCASLGQFRAYDKLIAEGKLKILFHAEEMDEVPGLVGVPSIYRQVTRDDQRQFMRFVFSSTEFGRPYILPPDVPKDRVDLMRAAFAATVKDPELLAEADRIKLDMSFREPQALERLVAKLYETPPDVIEAVKKLVPNLQ